jgi:hypothetical protein
MFTDMEKEYIRKLVEKELKKFKAEEKTILTEMSPGFMKGEAEYEEFLKGIIEKVKK